MVRNHQDGYPYINLSYFFFFVENIQKRKFIWKNWLVNEFRTAMGGGLLEISKKNISIFKTRQKMVTKFGQFPKSEMTLLFSSVLHIFFCWKYTESTIFWKIWLVNEFRTAMGGGYLGILKKYFHFQNLTKKGNKVWTI